MSTGTIFFTTINDPNGQHATSTGYVDFSVLTTSTPSTSPAYFNGFSYGEIVSTSFLFFESALLAFALFWAMTKGIKIKQ